VSEYLEELKTKINKENKNWKLQIIENFLGGVALACTILIVFFLFNDYVPSEWFIRNSFLIGLLFFFMSTFIRFFKDEFYSIPTLAFQLGRLSQAPKISALQTEIDKLKSNVSAVKVEKITEIDRTKAVALKMITMYYSGKKVSREACKKEGILEQEWESARELMYAAGVINEAKNKFIPAQFSEAKKKLMAI